MRRLIPALLFLLPSVLGAQAASFTYINQKAPYKNPSPAMLTALNLPKVGTTFKVKVPASYRLGTDYVFYSLAFGARNPDIPHAVLGGYLFSSAEIILQSPWGRPRSTATMSFPIPNSSQLLGLKFYQQVLRVVCVVNTCSNGLSRGGVGVIGK